MAVFSGVQADDNTDKHIIEYLLAKNSSRLLPHPFLIL